MAWALLAVALPAGADIGSTPLQAWRFSRNSVNGVARVGRTLYVGGEFGAVAPAANDVGALATLGASGTPTRRNARLDGSAFMGVDDGAGGYYVALGSLDPATNQPVYRLTHVRADGAVDAAFQPALNGVVSALFRAGTTLYAGGSFTAVNGQTRGRGAAFDITTGALLPWNPQAANGQINAISGAGTGRLYIGGSFDTVAGVTAIGLVRVTATTGVIDAFINVSLSPSGFVTSLTTVNNIIYVAGNFTTIGGFTRQGLAAIDLTTSTVTPFVANVSGIVLAPVSVIGGRLFIGGAFTAVNGTARKNLAQVDAVTGVVTTWQAPASDSVRALLGVGTTLYVGGRFTRVNGDRRAHVAGLDVANGAARVLPWDPGLTAETVALVAGPGGEVAAVGTEMAFGARVRDGIAAFDLLTNELLPFAPELNPPYATDIQATATTVYLAGFFQSVDGVTRRKLAAFDTDGGLLPWNPGPPSGVVTRIKLAGSSVFVGGEFTQVGGQPRVNLGAVDAVTGAARPFTIDANARVEQLRLVGNTLYAAGRFTAITGHPRSLVAAFDTTTGALLPFAPAIAGGLVVNDISAAGPLLYLTGGFTTVGGQPRKYVAAVDRVSGAVAPFAPVLDNFVDALVERNGAIYMAGDFTLVNAVARLGLAAVAAGDGRTTLPFDPRVPFAQAGNWESFVSDRDALMATFTYSTQPNLFIWPDAPPAGMPAPPIAPSASVTGDRLTVGWSASLLGPAPSSYVLEAAAAPGGPALAAVPVGPAASFSVGGVPPGLYFLRVRAVTAAGSSAASPEVGVAVGMAGCGAPPVAPGLTATAGGGDVALQWTPSAGLASPGYVVQAGTAPGLSNIGAANLGAATNFSGAAPAGVYYARVVSSSACGVSNPSIDVPLVVDTAPPPLAPVVAAAVSGSALTLSWTPSPGATSYRVEAGTGPLLRNLGAVTTAGPSLTAPGVPAGVYFVRVVAIGPSGESPRPDEIAVTVR